MEKTLENYLKKYKISYKEHFHNPVFRVVESKSVKLDIQGLHTKCLFLKGKSGNFYLVYPESNKVKIILDKEVWDSDIVNFHPNINNSTLEITHKALDIFFNSLKNKKYILEL